MANPKNREAVEQALQQELERDRTKTYVVEISPLGLVEMTRQNVTDGPREILTRKCPTCAGEGVVVSEATAVVDAERRLRALAASKPRTKAFKVELNAHVAELLSGPAPPGSRRSRPRRSAGSSSTGKDGVPHDHFTVLDEGTVEKLAVADSPVKEGQTIELKLVEVGRHDAGAGVGKLDGFVVCVGGAAQARRQEGLRPDRARARRHRLRDARRRRAPATGRADHRRGPGREADPRLAREEAPRPCAEAEAEADAARSRPRSSTPRRRAEEEVEPRSRHEERGRGRLPPGRRAEEEDPSRLARWTGTEEGRRAPAAAGAPPASVVRDDCPSAETSRGVAEVEEAAAEDGADAPATTAAARRRRPGAARAAAAAGRSRRRRRRGRRPPRTNGAGEPAASRRPDDPRARRALGQRGRRRGERRPAGGAAKKTRRGSRGGRRRRKPAGTGTDGDGRGAAASDEG